VSRGEEPIAELIHASLLHLLESVRVPGDPATARSLKSIRAALRTHDLDAAIRDADRAWRCLPEAAPTLASIYGQLLMVEGRDHDAALGLLRRANELSSDPNVAGLIVLALLRLRRPEDARAAFEAALSAYCVDPAGLLAGAGEEILRHPDIGAPGWIGRGPDLESVGQLASDEPNVLDISIDGGTAFAQLLPPWHRDGAQMFHINSPRLGIGTRFDVSSRGRLLLGSGLRTRTDFALDGRLANRGRRVQGWARIGWLPSFRMCLRCVDKDGRSVETRSRWAVQPGGRWPFAVNLRTAGLRGDYVHVSAKLPDGRWLPLPDSPLLLEPALQPERHRRLANWQAAAVGGKSQRLTPRRATTTDVIIPVYGNRAEALACIESVLATIDDTARVVVVDDASEDPALGDALDGLEADGRIQLLRNARNQGFVVSANRGVRLHPTHDAILLNSDTRVFDDWLLRLRAAAYAEPRVGTVTPWSNNGSIASYPKRSGAVVDPKEAAALHATAASALGKMSVEIPVGVGFCLYIRRDCLRDVGELDAAVFGQGYGEETDFCLRARQKGWSHRLAGDVFVYHAEGVSFGGRRAALLNRSQRLLNLRHPNYDRFIDSFLAQDPLLSMRRRIDERRLLAVEGQFALLVTLALTGGVARFVTDRCRELTAQGFVPLVLRPAAAGDSRRCELWSEALDLPNLQFAIPAELPELTALLRKLRLHAVEIQHFLHLDPAVVEAVRALPVPYDVVVHDYSWICPRVTLIDGSNRYCGEPTVSVCQACVRRNGSELGESISVAALRTRSGAWLRGARRVIAPSADTAQRFGRYFSDLSVDVRPHTPLIEPLRFEPNSTRRQTFRVALIGAIGTHKGYRILLSCARDARARKLPVEFVVIGHTENDAPLLATRKVFITGHYGEAEAPHLLQRERPDVAWLPSVWPETWCYTLDYALAAGLPIAAFDLGAIAERLRAAGVGELLPMELDPSEINDRLIELCDRTRITDLTKSQNFQSGMLQLRGDATMMKDNPGRMNMIKSSNNKLSQEVRGEGMSASVQVLPLPTGLYLFSVKLASAPPAKGNGQLSLPAVHVGLGPGVSSDQVEFIAGPSTHGAWLFSPGDLLVTKINFAGATLVLTSVRAPGGEVLSISVSRLDALTDVAITEEPVTVAATAKTAVASKKDTGNGVKAEPVKPVFNSAEGDLPLPVKLVAHIRTRGDMNFTNLPWAGRIAPGLWIESFSVRPLERFAAGDIEYKGLTGSGFETPWLSDEKMCGTKGMATPLVGFAIRLKPSAAAAGYDCEYHGYFQSGTTVGPLRNGAPCRSSVANDSLEGIQLRLVKRTGAGVLEALRKAGPALAPKPLENRKTAGSVKPLAIVEAVKPKPDNDSKVTKSRSTTTRAHLRGARSTRRVPTRSP
jgi:GT2 family glycosyltransferase/glycosyltransferase involved in cell wall biosynthesis